MKTVMTVLGEIAPDELGIVMPHEHIVCDIARHSGKATNRLNDIELCKRELGYFKRAGGRTMVDVTTSDIGRDAGALKQIARATGVNVVMGTGYYTEKTGGIRRSIRTWHTTRNSWTPAATWSSTRSDGATRPFRKRKSLSASKS